MSETLALGTALMIGDGGGPEVFTEVADLRDFSPPGLSVDTEETTNHSQADFYRQFRPTLIDPGELSGTLLFDPAAATHDDTTGVLSQLLDRLSHNFKIRFPTNPVLNWDFAGIVTQFEPGVSLDEHLTADFSVKLTAAVTIATQPIVTAVADTGADGPAYINTETMEFTVTFDKAVTVTGSPRITVNFLVPGDVVLTYASGSPGTALVFSLAIGPAGTHQADTGEVTMAAQSIDLNSGTMNDANGNPARLTIAAGDIASLAGVSVNDGL